MSTFYHIIAVVCAAAAAYLYSRADNQGALGGVLFLSLLSIISAIRSIAPPAAPER
jgi:hypothetical protein